MGWITKTKNYALTGIIIVCRMGYAAGQTFFNIESANKYLKINGKAGSTAVNAISITGTILSTLIGKSPAALKLFSSAKEASQTATIPQQLPPLGWTAWTVKKTIDGSGLFYGFTNSIAGYFGTKVLGEALGAKKKAPLIAVEVCSVNIALGSLVSYFAYDFKMIKKNSEIIARAIDRAITEKHIEFNKPLIYTSAAAVAIIPTYVGQAYFWAKPSIAALPYADAILHKTGIEIMILLACITTLFTVVGWLPSIYTYFDGPQAEPDEERVKIPKTSFSTALKIAAYAAGAIDSLGSNGLGPFISMIFTMTHLFNANPYSWIIGYAVLCGLFAALTNMMFSVMPGLDEAEQTIYKRSHADNSELLPLMVNPNMIFSSSMRSNVSPEAPMSGIQLAQ